MAVGLCSLGLAGLGVSLGWVCEPMNVQRWVLSYNRHNPSTDRIERYISELLLHMVV